MSNSSALQQAMNHHQKGELPIAINLYKKALKEDPGDKRIYLNLAAALRKEGEPEEAAKVASLGLNRIDQTSPILLNTLGNCLRDLGRYSEAINTYRRSLKTLPGYYDPQISIAGTLYDAGYKELSDRCLFALFKYYGPEKKGILHYLITREIERAAEANREVSIALEIILKHLDESQRDDETERNLPLHWYLVAQLCCDSGKVQESIKYYEKAKNLTQAILEGPDHSKLKSNAKRLHTTSSWNLSCNMLRQGEMGYGWELFDYGLNTPASGAQRWQRALYKPYSFSKVPLWKGQNLEDKTLLLLGEQGVGDTMAFMTLAAKLISKAKHVYFIVPDRLEPIYSRTLKSATIYSDRNFRENPLDFKLFDFQAPLGSVVQHEFKTLQSHKENVFRLRSDQIKKNRLRQKYLATTKNIPLIGISWQGGGKKDRINDKSIDLNLLLSELSKYNLVILSLQYGDDNEIVRRTAARHKLNIIDDLDIQATKDMDGWLSQVDACDGVISIANTTIHGAGGLVKPTLCLLGKKSDWRWLKDKNEKISYWYPSVEIAWQRDKVDPWSDALQQIPDWLKRHGFIK